MRLNPLFLARMLILLEIIALAVSTAATVVVEILIFITVLGFKDLRMRLLTSLRQPMVIMSMVLLAMVGLGIFYSIAPFSEGMDMWASWRKYLMVPFVVALYDDPKWKERFALVFIGLMSLAALISLAGVLFDFTIYYRFPVGIVVDNHATQGMFFSAAVFACLILLRFPPKEFKTPSWTLITAIILITLSIFLATPGRSGYLAFMVYITVFLFWSVRGIKRVLLMALAPVVIIMMLIASPVARDRIKLGFSEMQTYEQDKTVTSMGLRVIWWKNTLAILKKAEQPVFGYGTSGFEHAYAAHVKGQTGWQGKPTTDPHNQFLKIWVEHGIVGLAIFLGFIGSFFRQTPDKTFYYLGIGTLLAWCATSMCSGHFTTFHDGRFLLVWCGIMLASPLQKSPVST